MTVTLTPETEARLRARAEREGQDVDTVANALIDAALQWEEEDWAAAVAGIRRGLAASDAGRVRPASEVLAGLRQHLASTPE